jgi:hypothetical protein
MGLLTWRFRTYLFSTERPHCTQFTRDCTGTGGRSSPFFLYRSLFKRKHILRIIKQTKANRRTNHLQSYTILTKPHRMVPVPLDAFIPASRILAVSTHSTRLCCAKFAADDLAHQLLPVKYYCDCQWYLLTFNVPLILKVMENIFFGLGQNI